MDRTWNHNPIEASKLVGREVEVGHATLHVKVFAVGTSIQGADGHHKAETVG